MSSLPYGSLSALLDSSVQRYGTQTAYVGLQGRLSYAQLGRYSGQLAGFFQSHWGLPKGAKIAIQLPNVLGYPVVLFGAWRAGLVVVNANPLYTLRESVALFSDSGTSALVLFEPLAHRMDALYHSLPHLKERLLVIRLGDFANPARAHLLNFSFRYIKKQVKSYGRTRVYYVSQALRIGRQSTPKPLNLAADTPALLQYTGGTTGNLKAAVLTHHNLLANIEQIKQFASARLTEGKELFITALPLYHIYALTCGGLLSVRLGAKNVLVIDPRNLKKLTQVLAAYPFTIFLGVSTLFARLLAHKPFPNARFAVARIVISSGMALDGQVARQWHAQTGRRIREAYGMTEASPALSANPFDARIRAGSVGLPLAATHLKVVNEAGKAVPRGVKGEILAKGPQIMSGYWQKKSETKQAFSGSYLRTGDVGFIDTSGFLWVVDRKKEVINISGFNVYPAEIERVLAACPRVAEVGVTAVPDLSSGEVVKAYVVKSDPSLTKETLMGYARQHLTPYKRPRHIVFVDTLPKSHIGKVLRRLLPT